MRDYCLSYNAITWVFVNKLKVTIRVRSRRLVKTLTNK